MFFVKIMTDSTDDWQCTAIGNALRLEMHIDNAHLLENTNLLILRIVSMHKTQVLYLIIKLV